MKNVINWIITILFLLWFPVSLFLLVFFAKTDQFSLMFSTFGQYFLVFGIIAIKNLGLKDPDNIFLLLFPTGGIALLLIGISFYLNITLITDNIFFIIYIFLLLISMIIMIEPIAIYAKKYRNCNLEIDSNIVSELIQIQNYGHTITTPIYEIYYKYNTLQLCDNIYKHKNYTIGEKRKILINPDNPKEFIDKKRYFSIVPFVSGMLFIILIVLPLILN